MWMSDASRRRVDVFVAEMQAELSLDIPPQAFFRYNARSQF